MEILDEQIFLLYVDNELSMPDVTKSYLEHKGNFIVDTAISGKEGLQKIRDQKYDVVVSGYQMPEMNGLEFLKTVRSEGNNIPFIFFTGRGGEEVAIEALNAGADYYLRKGKKPKDRFGELQNFIRQSVERKRAEKEALESIRELTEYRLTEGLYKTIFENTGTAMAIIEDEITISYANDRMKQLLGYSEDDPEFFENWQDRIVEEDRDKVLQYHRIRRTNPDSVPNNYNLSLIHKNGELITTNLTTAMIPGTNKNIVSFIDITERKKAEQALAENEKKFREIFNSTSDIIFLSEFNPQTGPGRFIEVNDATCKKFGYSREELLQMSIKDIQTHETSDLAEDIARQFGTKGRATFEAGCIRKDGNIVSLENNSTFFKLNNRLVHLSVGRDITERKKAEKALKILNKKLNLLICHKA